MGRPRRSLDEAFWNKINIPEDKNKCWIWNGSRVPKGYGRTSYNGKAISAHKLSYKIHKGEIGDLFVLHSCDNPPCVNPDHLFLGTHQENMKDMRDKGRSGKPKGECNHASKLTKDEVLEMRKIHSAGEMGCRKLARKFGISKTNTRDILNRKTWTNI